MWIRLIALGLCWGLLAVGHADAGEGMIELTRRMAILEKEGSYAEALPLGQQAVELSEEILGPTHPTVAIFLDHLADVHQHLGGAIQAESLYRRALRIREEALGLDHAAVTESLKRLATLYVAQRRFGEAESLFQRTLTLTEQTHGRSHPKVARLLEQYAILLRETNRLDEAALMQARARAILHPVTPTSPLP